jgi:hypothetical protein
MKKKFKISEGDKFQTFPENLNLLNINDIVENTFLRFNILISNLFIYEFPKLIVIKLNIFYNIKSKKRLISPIIKYLKALLILKYNKNIQFNINLCKSIYLDDKILSNYIKKNFNIYTIKPLLNKIYGNKN